MDPQCLEKSSRSDQKTVKCADLQSGYKGIHVTSFTVPKAGWNGFVQTALSTKDYHVSTTNDLDTLQEIVLQRKSPRDAM